MDEPVSVKDNPRFLRKTVLTVTKQRSAVLITWFEFRDCLYRLPPFIICGLIGSDGLHDPVKKNSFIHNLNQPFTYSLEYIGRIDFCNGLISVLFEDI